jgi:hypothetical protein
MTYRKQSSKSGYRQLRRSAVGPNAHAKFREDWDKGLDAAMAQIKKLRSEGWIVDENRTWMRNQVSPVKKDFEFQGFDTETIPIANWAGEDVVFVAFRPHKAEPEPVTPPIASAKPQEGSLRTQPEPNFTAERAMQAYADTLEKPLVDLDNDNGFIMAPDFAWGFASRDASPSDQGKKDLLEKGRELALNPARANFNNAGNVRESFVNAGNAGKEVVDFVEPKGTMSTSGISIEKIVKALDALGGGDIRVVQEDSSNPAFIFNEKGDMVMIAPSLVEAEDEPKIVVKYGDVPGYSPSSH